jgi:tetratricopeptide (TPR) repeat protein
MPGSNGSLTTWGDTDFDDDFERWSPVEPMPDVEEPDPDSDDISRWLPVPEDSPLSLEHMPPFVDELDDEPQLPSDWETLPRYHPVESKPAPARPANISTPAPAEVPARSEPTLSQKAWERHVDVAVEERPEKDYTVVPQERPSRMEVEPAPRLARPELALAPAMPQLAPAETAQPDRDEDEMREIEMGIEKFRRVVQLNPANARAWDSLGSLYKSAGMYRDAILAYQQAISHDGTKSLYYHHLGLVYACEHRDADAIAAFQRVIEIDPEYSLAHATLGGYYRKMGLEELAQKHIGKAMKNIFDSENEYNRACLEAICGNADQAIKLLDVALKNKQTYVDWILRDPDLDFIRQDPRFKQLISRYTR